MRGVMRSVMRGVMRGVMRSAIRTVLAPRVFAALALGAGTVAGVAPCARMGAQVPPVISHDSLYARAQRLVSAGHADSGRALVDSLVQATRDGSRARAQALFWRATLAPDSASAERDFLVLRHRRGRQPRHPRPHPA
jgi:hypothetical protein